MTSRRFRILMRPLVAALLFTVAAPHFAQSAGPAAGAAPASGSSASGRSDAVLPVPIPTRRADLRVEAALAANRIPLLEADARFQGMYADGTFPFFVPDHWIVDGSARLELLGRHSELIRDSNLTVVVNQAPVRTVRLSSRGINPADNTFRISLEIPPGALHAGWNQLALRFYLRSSEDACKDLDNPGLWVAVDRTTSLEVPHRIAPATPDLSRFPESYVQSDRGAPFPGEPRVSLLLAGSDQPAVIDAAATLAARFGQTRMIDAGNLRAMRLEGSAPDDLAATHLVFVGLSGELDKLSAWGIDAAAVRSRLEAALAGRPDESHHAALLELVSPLNPTRRMLVATAADEEGMRILRANLARRGALNGLRGGVAVFPALPAPATEPAADPAKLTLEALGAGTLTVRGLSSRTARFKAPIPAHWRLTDQAHLKLYLSHSISLKKPSMLEVSLNGTPAYSLELLPELGAGRTRSQEVTVPIPPTLRGARALEVHLRLFLDVGSDDCSRPYDESAWASVRPDSYLYLAHEPADPDLSQYPDLLVGDGRLATTGLALGEAAGVEGLTALMGAAAALGAQTAGAERLELSATTTKELAEMPSSRRAARSWLVILGGGGSDGTKALTEGLPAAIDMGGRLDGAFLQKHPVPEGAAEGGVVQLAVSPWSPERVLVVASAPGADGMALNASVLGRAWGDARLAGQLTVLTDPPGAWTHRVPAAKKAGAAQDQPVAGSSRSWIWLVLSLAGFALAVGLLRAVGRRR